MFGIPGGTVLPLYDALLECPIRVIGARHEQGAGHMAEGYAQATGRPGVVLATSGPGAANLVTPLLDAMMDSVPLVAITGQVASHKIGTDAFQEAPIVAITTPCTKASLLATAADDIATLVHEAFRIATTGRPGPVVLDVPTDLLAAPSTYSYPQSPTTESEPHDSRVGDRVVSLLESANRPVLLAGGGIIAAEAHQGLLALAEAATLPVVTTLKARGAFPDHHRLALGMPGMHGVYTATTALQHADLLVVIGARFDDRITANPEHFAPRARVVHIDIDPKEIGKVRVPEVAIVGDAGTILDRLLQAWGNRPPPDRREWLETLTGWKRRYPLSYVQDADGPIKPQYVIERLREKTKGEATIVTGVGQHQMWASQFGDFRRPRSFVTSGGLGTMGFAVPAAIGAKLGRPDDLVYVIDGDGSFQMTSQELTTAAIYGIPIKVAVLNNGGYGMVRQWQDLFYRGRRHGVDLHPTYPDLAAQARSMGCTAWRVDRPEDVAEAIDQSLVIDSGPVVVEFRVDPDEMVFPMVVAGGNNDDIALGAEDLQTLPQTRNRRVRAGSGPISDSSTEAAHTLFEVGRRGG